MALVLLDDARARQFEPFALTRPAGELRAGGELTRRRWARILRTEATGFIGAPHLAEFEEFDAPGAASGTLPAGTWVANARCAPRLDGTVDGTAGAVRVSGLLAAVRLRSAVAVADLADGRTSLDRLAAAGEAQGIEGWWIDQVWDLIRHLNAMLAADVLAMAPSQTEVPPHVAVLGAHPVHIDLGAHVEPLVVIDATAGPVLVRRGATVQSFTRLVGPCIIGEDATVSGGRVAACSIGERVKVNGEISSTIMIGHANKGHDGFVGHSVIGRWANLGAATVTSNLKNSYGTVQLWTPRGLEETGLQFLGAMIGDHAKTGIGTRLTTGSVLGAGANVFGTAMPPKVVAPFAWGEAPAWETFAVDKFLEVSARVMARRGVTLGAPMRACLRAAHAARWSA